MSKAFTKDDDIGEPPIDRGGDDAPGPVTSDGRARLVAWAAELRARGDAAAAERLERKIERAEVVPSRSESGQDDDPRVRFGDALVVRVEAPSGAVERRVRIVGSIEVELGAEGGVEPLSVMTPLARALIGAEVGDVVSVDGGRDADEVEVEIVARLDA